MPDPKVEIVGIRELRLGEVLTMSYPGFNLFWGQNRLSQCFLRRWTPRQARKWN